MKVFNISIFTLKAPPFVSSDIDLEEHGLVHVRIASYESMHVTYTDGERTFSTFIRKQISESESKSNILNNWKPIILVAFIGLLQWGYQYFTKRFTIKEYNRQRQKEAKKKEDEEKEKKEKEDKDGEEEEEQKEKPEIKPPEPNAEGKDKSRLNFRAKNYQ